jgi:hypothetical protein
MRQLPTSLLKLDYKGGLVPADNADCIPGHSDCILMPVPEERAI